VIQFVQLKAATERIEELESQSEGDGGGLLGDFDDIFEDLLGDTEGLLEGTGDVGSMLECIGNPFEGSGEAGTTVEAIAEQVEGLRELRFTEKVEPRFLSDQEMNERVTELFLEDYTPKIADLEQRLLTTLGAIPPDTDLRELRSEAIGQQVAGFYEPETGELVVRQAGAELSAIDRITLAHELDHALTDQALGIPLPDDPEIGREDANLAALALAEGDATLVMQRYSATLGFDEQLGLLDPAAIAEAEAGLSGFPPYLEQELLFPYEEGLNFVCDLYAQGGWAAVNKAYEDPPETSEQILFPDLYLEGDRTVDLSDPPRPGRGWTELAHIQLGAANLLWLFNAPGGDRTEALEDPLSEAANWEGGEVTVWSRGDETALSMLLKSEEAGGQLCRAVEEWYGRSFEDDETEDDGGLTRFDGPSRDAVLACSSGFSIASLGIAPDVETATGLAVFV
jgi:hypothetical protein